MRLPPHRVAFWRGGASEYLDQLNREEQERLQALEQDLRSQSTPEGKDAVRKEIQALKEEYRKKRRDAAYSLFGKRA